MVMREFGAPEMLRPADVDEVTAGPGEVIIEAEFANVTFVETQMSRPRTRRSSPGPRSARRCSPCRASLGSGEGIQETHSG